MKCQKCNSEDNLIINSRYTTKAGEHKINYMCRICNLERSKKYRATPVGKEKVYNAVYRSTKKHWDKMLARQKVRWALKSGKLTKPALCSQCKANYPLEAHHDDYSKPLEVRWVCRGCHANIHRLQLKDGI